MRGFILKLMGKKEIKCSQCKRLKIVPKDYHRLKMCLDCKKRFDILIDTIRDISGLSK